MIKLRYVLMLCFMLANSDFLIGAEGEYTIRSNVSEVRLVFTAADAEGRRITRLEPKDVAVVDNEEIIRRFRSFGPASETPLHVVILIDTSSSVIKQVAKELALVETFVHGANWHDRDQVSILSFGGQRASIICKSTCRDQPISLATLAPGGITPMYDAVIAALALIAETRSENSRAAIVLISDGIDNYSYYGVEAAISAAQQGEASVYAINSRAHSGDRTGDSTLERMAADTGGEAFAQGRNTAEALSAILDDLRQGFLLTYELPRSASVRHEIRVVPTINSKLRFRCRKGYREIERAGFAGER
jgi:VWFA-related protein